MAQTTPTNNQSKTSPNSSNGLPLRKCPGSIQLINWLKRILRLILFPRKLKNHPQLLFLSSSPLNSSSLKFWLPCQFFFSRNYWSLVSDQLQLGKETLVILSLFQQYLFQFS